MRRFNPAIALTMSLLLLVTAACDLDGFIFNERSLDEYALPENTIPDSLITHVTFPSEGRQLHGFHVASAGGSLEELQLLYFHGNRDHMDHYWDRVMLLHELGVNLFVFDYRGFGLSDGEPSEKGLYRDADAALEHLDGRGALNADRLILYGFSLGSVPALHLAANRLDPAGVILESPFASATSLVQGSTLLDIPAGWLTTGTFDNREKIGRIDTRLLLIHGEEDDYVRFRDNGRVLFDEAPEPKALWIVAGAEHSDIPEVAGEQVYLKQLTEWLDPFTSP